MVNVSEYKVTLVKTNSFVCERSLTQANAAATLLRTYLGGADRESFVVVVLDRKNRPIAINTASMGSLTTSIVHPREVFKAAILANGASIILGHNHPSGDVQPSIEDTQITKRLVEAGKLLGIPVLDHIIVSTLGEDYYSYSDNNRMND